MNTNKSSTRYPSDTTAATHAYGEQIILMQPYGSDDEM